MSVVRVPALCLVVVLGGRGSGRTAWAARRFRPSEIVSFDAVRASVSDDPDDPTADAAADALVLALARARLERGALTVVDGPYLRADARQALVSLARELHVAPVAIVLDPPDGERVARGAHPREVRADRRLLAAADELGRGFREVHTLVGDAIDAAEIVREPMSSDRRHLTGPFDLIGDVHGCDEELRELLVELGWRLVDDGRPSAVHPEGRTLVFVGDLADRGPDSPAVLERVMNLVEDGRAWVVVGNHDYKLGRALRGEKLKATHGLDRTLAQLEARDAAFRARVAAFVDQLPSHAVFDGGRLVVAHAGLPEAMHGRSSGPVRSFAMYGETTGETDAYGLPVRLDWARNYRGRALVVHGHVPVVVPEWNHGTLDIDTGCCFGGALTALRYPERALVSVDAVREHYPPTRPLTLPEPSRDGESFVADDLVGRRPIVTALGPRVAVSEANGWWAIEQLSRFAIDPGWLVAAPLEDARADTPEAALAAYLDPEIVCAPLSPGERVVVAVCRDADAARARFGVADGARAAAWDGRGRSALAADELATLAEAVDRRGWWESLGSAWVVLDAVVAPPSAGPGPGAIAADALARGLHPLAGVPERALAAARIEQARQAPPGPAVAPVVVQHLLASEGAVYTDRPIRWHRERVGPLDPRPVSFVSRAEVRAVAGSAGLVVRASALVARAGARLAPAGFVVGAGPADVTQRQRAVRTLALADEALRRFVAGEPRWRVHQVVGAAIALGAPS